MMLACLLSLYFWFLYKNIEPILLFHCLSGYKTGSLFLCNSPKKADSAGKMQFTLILGKDTWPFVREVIRVPKALCFVHLLAESHCKFISDTWYTINISYIKSDVWAYYCSSCRHVISVWVTFVHTCFKAQLYRFLWSHTSIAPGIYNTRHISLNSTTIQLITAV